MSISDKQSNDSLLESTSSVKVCVNPYNSSSQLNTTTSADTSFPAGK
ncbi:unnamed protein product [Trichobilharzia regenti]|nr:unnamed protein product [Trichobilharzia regenti]